MIFLIAVHKLCTCMRDFRNNNNIIVIYVVVQFYPWFKFYFPLFLGLVMYDNDFKTKGDKFERRIKLNYHMHTQAIVSL